MNNEKKFNMVNKTIIGFIIALLVVGAGAFYGGLQYGKSQNGGSRQPRFVLGNGQPGLAGQFNRQGAAGRAGGGFVNGDIIAKDDKSITVKMVDGGSKIIFLSGSTQITKSASGSAVDLLVGKNVIIYGSANADGSITAQSIQSRPASSVNASSTPQQ